MLIETPCDENFVARKITRSATRMSDPELAGIPVSKLHTVLDEEDFFPCRNFQELQQERELRASLTSELTLGSNEVREIETLLEAYRTGICGLLSQLRALLTATERLGARYFPGRKMLSKSYIDAFNELEERAGRLADNYNLIADYIKGEDKFTFGAKLAGRIKKIDRNAVDPATGDRVTSLVGKLVALARAQMLFSFDEDARAIEILKPLMQRETAAPGPTG